MVITSSSSVGLLRSRTQVRRVGPFFNINKKKPLILIVCFFNSIRWSRFGSARAKDVTSAELEIQDKVKQVLAVPVTTSFGSLSQGTVFLPNVFTILESYWSIILYRYFEKGTPVSETISEFESVESRFQRRIDPNGILWLGGYGLMQGTQNEKQVVTTIEHLRGDRQIVDKLVSLKQEQKSIISKSSDVAKTFEDISSRIDARKYKTIVSCCPR